MKKEQRKRIIDKHRDSLTRHGYHPNALYWSSKEIQEIRFKILSDIGIESGDSVLDVGCGFGDFKRWFEMGGGRLKFSGVDLSPDMVAVAEEKHSDACFYSGELADFDFAPASFDWAILSGALNEQLHDDGAYARHVISDMYRLCRKGVAFNMLDARQLQAHDLQSVSPNRLLTYCEEICEGCELYDDYLANDFTIHMCR